MVKEVLIFFIEAKVAIPKFKNTPLQVVLHLKCNSNIISKMLLSIKCKSTHYAEHPPLSEVYGTRYIIGLLLLIH